MVFPIRSPAAAPTPIKATAVVRFPRFVHGAGSPNSQRRGGRRVGNATRLRIEWGDVPPEAPSATIGLKLNGAMFDPTVATAIRMPKLEPSTRLGSAFVSPEFLMSVARHAVGLPYRPRSKQHWSCVFHASSTAPVPQTAEGAVGEGWETQLPKLNGAMFSRTTLPVLRTSTALGANLNGAMFDPDVVRSIHRDPPNLKRAMFPPLNGVWLRNKLACGFVPGHRGAHNRQPNV